MAHVLLEASQELAALVWRMRDKPMAVCTPALSASSIGKWTFDSTGNPQLDERPMITLVGLAGMIIRHVYYGHDFGDHDRFVGWLEAVRTKLQIPHNEDIVLINAGTHTTLFPTVESGASQTVGLVDLKAFEEIPYNRSKRRTAALVYETLNAIPGLKMAWLADEFPALKPTTRASRADLEMADLARRNIELDAAKAPNVRDPNNPPVIRPFEMKQPSIPYVFYYPEGDKDRRSYYGGRAREPNTRYGTPYSTTDYLLDDFRDNVIGPASDPVLVKVAPADLSRANPLDPPVIRERHLLAAAQAGISRILLDERVGVIDTTPTEDWSAFPDLTPPEIFAA